MQENISLSNHGIILENRRNLSVSGVSDCLAFDEQTIVLQTKLGRLTIKGEGLHIHNFDTSSGDLTAEGKIYALGYTHEDNKQSLFGKIFR